MKEEIKNGYIIYRKPNVAEKLIILGEMGIGETELEEMQESDGKASAKMWIFAGKMIKKLAEFVEEVKVDHNGEVITAYSELLKHDEYIADLAKVSQSLLSTGISEEKKS